MKTKSRIVPAARVRKITELSIIQAINAGLVKAGKDGRNSINCYYPMSASLLKELKQAGY